MNLNRMMLLPFFISLYFFASINASSDDLIGNKAKNFTLPVAGKKEKISLKSYQHQKIVIIHFWKCK